MRSRTKAAEVVRTYFLRMEALARMYFDAKTVKLERNVARLLENQRLSSAVASARVSEDSSSGYIYIFETPGRVENLYHLGP